MKIKYFDKKVLFSYVLGVSLLTLYSCDNKIDTVSPQSSILDNVPAKVIVEMNTFNRMTLNAESRVEAYLAEMTPEKQARLNYFKDIQAFNKLGVNEQATLVSEILGFENVQECNLYLQSLNTRESIIAEWSRDEKKTGTQVAEYLNVVSDTPILNSKGMRISADLSDIPDDWLDIEAYASSGGACQEYRECVNGKFGDGIAGTVGAGVAGLIFGGPTGAFVGLAGGWISTAFVVINGATFGDCAGKRKQCQVFHHPYNGGTGTFDGEVDDYNPNKGKTLPGGPRPSLSVPR